MTDHALFSASGAKGWMTCAAKLAMESDLPNRESSYAQQGTLAHQLAETCLTTQTLPYHYLGQKLVPEIDMEVDQEMVSEVRKYIDYVMDLRKHHAGDDLVFHVEERVDYSDSIGQDDSFGTSDVLLLAGEDAHVVDLKYGQGVEVYAEHNPQGMLYALGLLERYGLSYDIKRVTIHIVQPRKNHFDSWTCEVDELLAFAQEAKDRASLARDMLDIGKPRILAEFDRFEDSFAPTEEACRWCRAKATCPALEREVARTVSFGNDATLDDFTEDYVDAVPHANADRLGAIMDRVDLLLMFIKAVETEAAARTTAGDPPVGADGPYKFVEGRKGARAWLNEAEAEALLKSFRLKTDEMYNYKLISPTQAAKVLESSPQRWAKAQALIGQADGKPKLVKGSDKKPAIQVAISADDFTDDAD